LRGGSWVRGVTSLLAMALSLPPPGARGAGAGRQRLGIPEFVRAFYPQDQGTTPVGHDELAKRTTSETSSMVLFVPRSAYRDGARCFGEWADTPDAVRFRRALHLFLMARWVRGPQLVVGRGAQQAYPPASLVVEIIYNQSGDVVGYLYFLYHKPSSGLGPDSREQRFDDWMRTSMQNPHCRNHCMSELGYNQVFRVADEDDGGGEGGGHRRAKKPVVLLPAMLGTWASMAWANPNSYAAGVRAYTHTQPLGSVYDLGEGSPYNPFNVFTMANAMATLCAVVGCAETPEEVAVLHELEVRAAVDPVTGQALGEAYTLYGPSCPENAYIVPHAYCWPARLEAFGFPNNKPVFDPNLDHTRLFIRMYQARNEGASVADAMRAYMRDSANSATWEDVTFLVFMANYRAQFGDLYKLYPWWGDEHARLMKVAYEEMRATLFNAVNPTVGPSVHAMADYLLKVSDGSVPFVVMPKVPRGSTTALSAVFRETERLMVVHRNTGNTTLYILVWLVAGAAWNLPEGTVVTKPFVWVVGRHGSGKSFTMSLALQTTVAGTSATPFHDSAQVATATDNDRLGYIQAVDDAGPAQLGLDERADRKTVYDILQLAMADSVYSIGMGVARFKMLVTQALLQMQTLSVDSGQRTVAKGSVVDLGVRGGAGRDGPPDCLCRAPRRQRDADARRRQVHAQHAAVWGRPRAAGDQCGLRAAGRGRRARPP
jgi:hypothetical protein